MAASGSITTASTSTSTLEPSNTFKYGMPVYGLVWPSGDTFFLCGGGGSVSSGIRNRVVGAQRALGALLTDQVVEHDFGKNCPMKLAVHPSGKTLVAAMAQGGVVRLDLEAKGKALKLAAATGDFAERLGADRTEVKSLAFSPRGDALVLGGVDGSLKVLGWPALDVKLHLKGDERLPDGVRDVSVEAEVRASQVAVVLDNGTAQVWDWDKQRAVCKVELPRGEARSDAVLALTGPGTSSVQALPSALHGARFVSLRFAAAPPSPPGGRTLPPEAAAALAERTLLYALMNTRRGTHVVVWEQDPETGLLALCRHTRVSDEPSSCFDVSPCGKLLAVGTSQSSIVVLHTWQLVVQRKRPKAHKVFCTAVAFSPDSKHVLSASGDASATLTATAPEPSKVPPFGKIVMLLLILVTIALAILVQVIKDLKRAGNHGAVERIGKFLRALGLPLGAPTPYRPYWRG